MHWHGLALRNDMDGVPHLTQEPIAAGKTFEYVFTDPDPGTYFYHPHTGVQFADFRETSAPARGSGDSMSGMGRGVISGRACWAMRAMWTTRTT